MPRVNTVDRNGRLTLGRAYAGQIFMVKKVGEGRFVLTLGKVVPASEAWVHENAEVRRALKESTEGAPPAKAPNLAADARLLDEEVGA